jgi:hypothetical protein
VIMAFELLMPRWARSKKSATSVQDRWDIETQRLLAVAVAATSHVSLAGVLTAFHRFDVFCGPFHDPK